MTYVATGTKKASIMCLFAQYHNTCIERLRKSKAGAVYDDRYPSRE
jgi:hypothetical protein